MVKHSVGLSLGEIHSLHPPDQAAWLDPSQPSPAAWCSKACAVCSMQTFMSPQRRASMCWQRSGGASHVGTSLFRIWGLRFRF